jgi:transcriptional regulator with XRE-family HTH domain
LTPEMCRAARALLNWEPSQLARAAGLRPATVNRFEAGATVKLWSVEAMLQALQNAGIEFIAAGGKSLDGGPGLRTVPVPEPEVAKAEEAAELELPPPPARPGTLRAHPTVSVCFRPKADIRLRWFPLAHRAVGTDPPIQRLSGHTLRRPGGLARAKAILFGHSVVGLVHI